jgi:hypothetical protein
MRLLKARDDGGFSLTIFPVKPPPYAILSHTWEADDQEVKLQDIEGRVGTHKTGYRKIEFCARQAQNDDLAYFWVDSCCIDQSSSAELSTAINSMYRWYQNSVKCYVYMADVSISSSSDWESSFLRSRWFTRGWTLQELIAPKSIEFFSANGMYLGNKTQLEDLIQEITGISNKVLRGHPPAQVGVEERLSWIANRDTKFGEDIVYSVLGLFGIHMLPMYGERAVHAFQRLGLEIERSFTFTQPRRSTCSDLEVPKANSSR